MKITQKITGWSPGGESIRELAARPKEETKLGRPCAGDERCMAPGGCARPTWTRGCKTNKKRKKGRSGSTRSGQKSVQVRDQMRAWVSEQPKRTGKGSRRPGRTGKFFSENNIQGKLGKSGGSPGASADVGPRTGRIRRGKKKTATFWTNRKNPRWRARSYPNLRPVTGIRDICCITLRCRKRGALHASLCLIDEMRHGFSPMLG